jgi:hypothetical protein
MIYPKCGDAFTGLSSRILEIQMRNVSLVAFALLFFVACGGGGPEDVEDECDDVCMDCLQAADDTYNDVCEPDCAADQTCIDACADTWETAVGACGLPD